MLVVVQSLVETERLLLDQLQRGEAVTLACVHCAPQDFAVSVVVLVCGLVDQVEPRDFGALLDTDVVVEVERELQVLLALPYWF